MGTVRQVSQSSGQVTLAQSYDPFGGLLSQDGTGTSGFGYTGQQEDASTGLVFLRARYYDPAVGRFVSRDPWPGFDIRPQTQNGWSYVSNNPINRLDPSGLCGTVGDISVVGAVFPLASCIPGGGSGAAALGSASRPIRPSTSRPSPSSSGILGLLGLGFIADAFSPDPVVAPPGLTPVPVPAPAPPIPLDDVGGVGEAMSPDELSELFNRPSANNQRPTSTSRPGEDYPPIPVTPTFTPTPCPDDDSNRFYYAQRDFAAKYYTEAGYEELLIELLNSSVARSGSGILNPPQPNDGLAKRLQSEWNTYQDTGLAWRRNIYSGIAFQGQRVLYYDQHQLALSTTGSRGIPDIELNWITGGTPSMIEAAEIKWNGSGAVPGSLAGEIAQYHSRFGENWIVEVSVLNEATDAYLRNLGGVRFDESLYPN